MTPALKIAVMCAGLAVLISGGIILSEAGAQAVVLHATHDTAAHWTATAGHVLLFIAGALAARWWWKPDTARGRTTR